MNAVRIMIRRWAWISFAMLALVNAGCLLVAAGATAGAVAGYYYVNGLLYRDYHASLADTLAAVRASLGELEFPIIEQTSEAGGAYVKTKTSNGTAVRIHLDVINSPIPSEKTLTRIGIRVGFSGDEAVSARILDQINTHLVAPGLLPAPPATTGGASIGAPQPVGGNPVKQTKFETPPPPLASPQPVTLKGAVPPK